MSWVRQLLSDAKDGVNLRNAQWRSWESCKVMSPDANVRFPAGPVAPSPILLIRSHSRTFS